MKKTVGVIGVPTFGKVTMDWNLAFSGLQKPLASSWIPWIPRNKRIDEARNEIIEFALSPEINAEYVLFIDDDVLVPPNALLQMLNRRKDIVNGVYIGKCEEGFMPLLFREQIAGPYVDWKKGEFFQIDSAGCGCTLIKTDVFRKLEKPWFDIYFNLTGKNNAQYGQGTEDLFFYGKCRNAGIEVWADTSIICGHIDINTGKIFVVPHNHPNITGEPKHDATGKKVIDLGSGGKDSGYNYFGENADITRVDIREEVNPDVRMDIQNLDGVDDEAYDIVHASNVLQFFAVQVAQDLLKEWFKKVKIGGKLVIVVPDILKVFERVKEEKGLSPTTSNLIYGAKMHRKDFALTGFTEQMLRGLFNDKLHGLDLKSVKLERDDTEMFMRIEGVRSKTSIAHKDQGVFMHNLIRQSYTLFAIQRLDGTLVNSSNFDMTNVVKNPKSFIVIGVNGETSGDQVAFSVDTGKWYRNGTEYLGVDHIDLMNKEMELLWTTPKKGLSIEDPEYFFDIGYKVGNSTIVAKVLSDGSVNFTHKIKKPKVQVSQISQKAIDETRPYKKESEKKKTKAVKKPTSKKAKTPQKKEKE